MSNNNNNNKKQLLPEAHKVIRAVTAQAFFQGAIKFFTTLGMLVGFVFGPLVYVYAEMKAVVLRVLALFTTNEEEENKK